jgi:hypothetical protein
MTAKQISKLIQQYTKAKLEECEEERLKNLKDYHDNELDANSLIISTPALTHLHEFLTYFQMRLTVAPLVLRSRKFARA